MTWDEIKQFLEKFMLGGAVITMLSAVIEIIFKPFRKYRERKKIRESEENERLKRERRTDELLLNINKHLEEAQEIEKWREAVDKKLTEHEEAIQDSKNERRVVWRAQRATLSGLMQLLDGKNEVIAKAILEMDEYTDEKMR